MQKITIYTAMCLSMMPSSLIASNTKDDPAITGTSQGTPVKVKQELEAYRKTLTVTPVTAGKRVQRRKEQLKGEYDREEANKAQLSLEKKFAEMALKEKEEIAQQERKAKEVLERQLTAANDAKEAEVRKLQTLCDKLEKDRIQAKQDLEKEKEELRKAKESSEQDSSIKILDLTKKIGGLEALIDLLDKDHDKVVKERDTKDRELIEKKLELFRLKTLKDNTDLKLLGAQERLELYAKHLGGATAATLPASAEPSKAQAQSSRRNIIAPDVNVDELGDD